MKEKLGNNLFVPENSFEINETLFKFSNLVQEQIKFGFQILIWDSEIEREEIGDARLVPILFLRNILELSDGISALIKNSSIEPINILFRSIYENYFYLEHIFEKHFEERSLSYIYLKTLNKISLLDKTNPETGEGEKFKKSFLNDKLFAKEISFDHIKLLEYRLNAISLLELEHFKVIKEEYDRLKELKEYKNNYKQIPWYLLFEGAKNIRQLAISLKLNGIYDGFYSIHSSNVHSSDVFSGAISKGKNGEAEILQIRIPENAQSMTIQILIFLEFVFKLYIEKRVPNKISDLLKWQIEAKKKRLPLEKQKIITVTY